MFLQQLQLQRFRNYGQQVIQFAAPKVILMGENAQGKSNLLEAVALLSTLRSNRTSRDRDLVQTCQSHGCVEATILRESGGVDLTLQLRANGRRTLKVNQEVLRRHLDFLGHLNTVQFSSLDLELIRGGPGERRQWLDGVLVQLEPVYARILQEFHQALRQRNAFLKHQQQGPWVDDRQAAVWDQLLVQTGVRVIRRRQRLLQRLLPLAQAWHETISGQRECLNFSYLANIAATAAHGEAIALADAATLRSAFEEALQRRAKAEQYQGTTLTGPHRDEVRFTINDTPARQYGSQGQQRTLVLALKLAELQLVTEVIGEPPLLLLDDVLAELDLARQHQLLEALQLGFQTLITTTHLNAFAQPWLDSAQLLMVKQGQILPSLERSP